MSHTTRTIVSDLMKTYNTLNGEGAGYLLENGVSIGSEAELSSFIYFLAARGNPDDFLHRLSFFDKLTLHFDFPSPDIARVLAEFFEKVAPMAFNFTSLEIYDAEALLASYPPLGAAIAKLTILEALELSSAGEHCATLLRTLQSRLVEATISFGDGEQGDDILEHDRNPILLLRGSQYTLKSLSTTFAASSLFGPCYTNVTDLSLAYTALPFIEDYINTFPNLLSLSVFECSGYRDDLEAWMERRMASMEHQTQYGTWQTLRRYSGSVLILWILGLICHISSIELDFEDHILDIYKLNDVLQDVRPSRLVLELPEASCLLREDVHLVLGCANNLREFDLRVKFNFPKDGPLFVGDILNTLVDIVRASSANIFKLSLDYSQVVSGVCCVFHGERMPMTAFEDYLQNMDVDGYADALFASVASLKKLQVSVVGPKQSRRQADRRRM